MTPGRFSVIRATAGRGMSQRMVSPDLVSNDLVSNMRASHWRLFERRAWRLRPAGGGFNRWQDQIESRRVKNER